MADLSGKFRFGSIARKPYRGRGGRLMLCVTTTLLTCRQIERVVQSVGVLFRLDKVYPLLTPQSFPRAFGLNRLQQYG